MTRHTRSLSTSKSRKNSEATAISNVEGLGLKVEDGVAPVVFETPARGRLAAKARAKRSQLVDL